MDWGIIATILSSVFVPVAVGLWAAFVRLRDNEIHDLKTRLERIENKLDKHIEMHTKII